MKTIAFDVATELIRRDYGLTTIEAYGRLDLDAKPRKVGVAAVHQNEVSRLTAAEADSSFVASMVHLESFPDNLEPLRLLAQQHASLHLRNLPDPKLTWNLEERIFEELDQFISQNREFATFEVTYVNRNVTDVRASWGRYPRPVNYIVSQAEQLPEGSVIEFVAHVDDTSAINEVATRFGLHRIELQPACYRALEVMWSRLGCAPA